MSRELKIGDRVRITTPKDPDDFYGIHNATWKEFEGRELEVTYLTHRYAFLSGGDGLGWPLAGLTLVNEPALELPELPHRVIINTRGLEALNRLVQEKAFELGIACNVVQVVQCLDMPWMSIWDSVLAIGFGSLSEESYRNRTIWTVDQFLEYCEKRQDLERRQEADKIVHVNENLFVTLTPDGLHGPDRAISPEDAMKLAAGIYLLRSQVPHCFDIADFPWKTSIKVAGIHFGCQYLTINEAAALAEEIEDYYKEGSMQ